MLINIRNSKLFVLFTLILIVTLLSACGSNKNTVEKKLVGKWEITKDKALCDFVDGDTLRINSDNTIENLIDYEEYSIDDTEENYHLVVKGFGETNRFIFSFNDDELLEMYEQDSEEDLFCTLKKVK